MTTQTGRDNIKLIGDKIKGIRIAMMTTAEADGTLRSRPMATQDMEFDGTLWFFTLADAPKVGEIESDQQVNLSYAKPDDERYVSISGTAQLVRDQQKVKDLWKPILKVWFANGENDPNLALLKVDATQAEYWDSPSSKMVQVVLMAKAAVTGSQDALGENKKVNIS
jgi:general stress protein 26